MSYRSIASYPLPLALASALVLTACGGDEEQEKKVDAPTVAQPAAAPAGTGSEVAPSSEQAVQASQIEQLMRMLDTDGDGRISRDEHLTKVHGMFERMDVDRDGQVNVEEMDAVRSELHGEGRTPSQAELSKVDSDGNNTLSAEEHAKSTQVEFERMDRDHDGYLTVSELETAQNGQ